jgi:phosphatidylinositol glycan class B
MQPVLMGLAGLGRDHLGKDLGSEPVHTGRKKAVLAFLLISNLGAACYFARWHQTGCIAVIDHLRVESKSVQSVLFLMPCHSTPFYGRLHRKVPMRMLDCAPPVDALSHRVFGLEGYVDEADRFYKDPVGMSRGLLDGSHSHVLLFEALLQADGMAQVLTSSGYRLHRSFFNSHFNPDARRRGNILLYTKYSR